MLTQMPTLIQFVALFLVVLVAGFAWTFGAWLATRLLVRVR